MRWWSLEVKCNPKSSRSLWLPKCAGIAFSLTYRNATTTKTRYSQRKGLLCLASAPISSINYSFSQITNANSCIGLCSLTLFDISFPDGQLCFSANLDKSEQKNIQCPTKDNLTEGVVIMWIPEHLKLLEMNYPWRHYYKSKRPVK